MGATRILTTDFNILKNNLIDELLKERENGTVEGRRGGEPFTSNLHLHVNYFSVPAYRAGVHQTQSITDTLVGYLAIQYENFRVAFYGLHGILFSVLFSASGFMAHSKHIISCHMQKNSVACLQIQ